MKRIFKRVACATDDWRGRFFVSLLGVVSLALLTVALPAHAGDRLPWSARVAQAGVAAELELNDAQRGAVPMALS